MARILQHDFYGAPPDCNYTDQAARESGRDQIYEIIKARCHATKGGVFFTPMSNH